MAPANPPPAEGDPVAEAAAIIQRALEREGRPATPLELAQRDVAHAYLEHYRTAKRAPCNSCRCCKSWHPALELLRAHLVRHQAQLDEFGEGPTLCGFDDCLACAQLPGWNQRG